VTVAIKVVGAQMPDGTVLVPESGRYLCQFDVAGHDGRSWIPTTDDITQAALFPTVVEALEFWRTKSLKRALRPDGQPNRPLTAYTVELVNAP
jgi:hypothetical protein